MWRLLLSIWSAKKDCAFRKLRKITMLACVLLIMIPLSLTACGGRANTSSSVYPVSYTHLDVYKRQNLYRADMNIYGYHFGKGEKSACIVGACRGNEIQQLYICSQLVRKLKELEERGAIVKNNEILVIPSVNPVSYTHLRLASLRSCFWMRS